MPLIPGPDGTVPQLDIDARPANLVYRDGIGTDAGYSIVTGQFSVNVDLSRVGALNFNPAYGITFPAPVAIDACQPETLPTTAIRLNIGMQRVGEIEVHVQSDICTTWAQRAVVEGIVMQGYDLRFSSGAVVHIFNLRVARQ
jgi:hypothetical protein